MDTKFIKSTTYGGVTFRYSIGKSLASGKELHPHHEILYYLGGDAEFLSTEYHLRPNQGTLFVIPKEHFHNFRIGDEDGYTRLTIAFGDSALPPEIGKFLSGIRVITPTDKLRGILDSMRERLIECADAATTSFFMYGAFLMMISLIADMDDGDSARIDKSSIIDCVRFIDGHFAEELSLSRLCAESHLSESALFRLFKKELGISPYKYITERRLIEANKLIVEGHPATVVASLAGFSDYSAFYKAYIKKFGMSPSRTD